MCLNKKQITLRSGKTMFVNCGHCEACQQEKAINRTYRIRAEESVNTGRVCMFLTLTYDNKHIPFFYKEELDESPIYFKRFDDNVVEGVKDVVCSYKSLNVYRMFGAAYRNGKNYATKRVITPFEHLTSVNVPYFEGQTSNLKPLQNDPYTKSITGRTRIGCLYYPDVQNFIKRLRINWLRTFGADLQCSFYACSEIGPTTLRPHFHLLLWLPVGFEYSAFEHQVIRAWPYASSHVIRKGIEYARSPAGYVASYVNCSSYIPKLFKVASKLSPAHSYSKGFGIREMAFTLPKVYESYLRRDLHYTSTRWRDSALIVDSFRIPRYVVSRFAPKFKGFSRFSRHELYNLVCEPSQLPSILSRRARECDYSKEDVTRISVMLRNKRSFWLSNGFSLDQMARFYSEVWTIFNSNLLGDFYQSITTNESNFTAYDNINEFYDNAGLSPSLEDASIGLRSDFVPIRDCNEFPINRAKHNNLISAFYSYEKQRATLDYVNSQI